MPSVAELRAGGGGALREEEREMAQGAWGTGPPKIAAETPERGAAPTFALGSRVRVVPAGGDAAEGEVFAYDPSLATLVLSLPGLNPQTHDLCVVNVSKLAEATELAAAPGGGASMPELPVVDVTRCMAREEAAVRRAQEQSGNIGVGVSDEAQDVFDALAKTMPCAWDGRDIVVMQMVRIKEPYNVAACSGGDGPALQRVQKVLGAELKRLGLAA